MSPKVQLLATVFFIVSTIKAHALGPAFPESRNIKPVHFDTQDVSYLWPAYDEKKLLPAIDPKDRTKDLLPSRKIYKKLQTFLELGSNQTLKNPITGQAEYAATGTDTVGTNPLETFHVVGFRVDNCGPFAGHRNSQTQSWQIKDGQKSLTRGTAECLPQLRLVLQPDMYWEDVALHFVYQFSRSDGTPNAETLQSLVKDLAYLKSINPVSTDGKKLGPQIGLNDARFNAKVQKFLRHYARPTALTEIAVLSTNAFDGNNDWVFTSIHIDSRNPHELTLKPNLALQGSPLTIGFESKSTTAQFERPSVGIASPETVDLETILRLTNPQVTSNQSADCLSCHSETRSLIYKSIHQAEDFARLTDMKTNLPGFKRIQNLPQSAVLPNDVDGIEGNFRQFGFFNKQPVVTFRTAFESAQVAAALNEILSGTAEPKAENSHDILKAMQCLIETTNDGCN